MSSTKEPVAFIGLGAMGFGMAAQLITQCFPVTGFDISTPTLQKLQKLGGNVATSPGEAAKSLSHCICMVATAQQAQQVLFDCPNPAVPALAKGATLLLCSTVPCGYVEDLQKSLEDQGRSDILLVDCPVSGGAKRAADGTLSIMAGGSDEAIDKGRELLAALSDPQKLYVVKGGIGAGSSMKMAHQVLAATHILAASESLGFARRLGLDLATTGDALVSSKGRSWMLENRLPRMVDLNLPIASAVTIILKDTSIITSEARRYGFPTPMSSTAEQAYFLAVDRGFGRDDDSSLTRLYEQEKGSSCYVDGVSSSEDKTKLVVDLLEGIHVCAAAEALAFAHRVGLDLDQVYKLCVDAAGGSEMLTAVGQDIIHVLRGQPVAVQEGLVSLAEDLEKAASKAQSLRMPLFLGNQALTLFRLVLRHKPKERLDASIALAVKAWAA